MTEDERIETDEESASALEDAYDDLFECIEDVVEASPEHVPELFTLILALPPFREFLNRQELLNKAIVEAKKLVSEAEKGVTGKQLTEAALAGQRPLNVQQLLPKQPTRA